MYAMTKATHEGYSPIDVSPELFNKALEKNLDDIRSLQAKGLIEKQRSLLLVSAPDTDQERDSGMSYVLSGSNDEYDARIEQNNKLMLKPLLSTLGIDEDSGGTGRAGKVYGTELEGWGRVTKYPIPGTSDALRFVEVDIHNNLTSPPYEVVARQGELTIGPLDDTANRPPRFADDW